LSALMKQLVIGLIARLYCSARPSKYIQSVSAAKKDSWN